MLKFLFIILNSLIISGTVNFSVDMSNIDFPNDNYQSAVVNGSWNSWSGWGLTLNDDNEDGIYEGVLEVENGTYEYVIALTGTEDNWSGWGQTINAPIGSSCDWNPNDQWANYGFNINDNDTVTILKNLKKKGKIHISLAKKRKLYYDECFLVIIIYVLQSTE